MHIFHNRPLGLAACLLSLASVLAFPLFSKLKLGFLIAALVLLVLCVVFYLAFRKKARVKRVLFCVLLCLIGVCIGLGSSFAFFDVRYQNAQELVGKELYVKGRINARAASASYAGLFDVTIEEIDGKACSMRVLLQTEYASAMQGGDAFCATVTPRAFEEGEDFDERKYRLSNGYLLLMVCRNREDCSFSVGGGKSLLSICNHWNLKLGSRILNTVKGEEGALAVAILLGDRSYLSPTTTLAFSRTGTTHLLALSGLHITVLLGLLEILLRRMHVPKILRVILLPLFSIGYMALTGFLASICRAVLMSCIMYLGFLVKEEYDSFTALCVALAAMLTVTPYAILDLSLWLSFLSTAGIVVFMPAYFAWAERKAHKASGLSGRIRRWLLDFLGSILVGVASNFALMLLLALTVGEFSLLAIPTTLILSTPTTLVLIFSLLMIPLPMIPLLPILCRWMGTLTLWVADLGSSLPGVLLSVRDLLTVVLLILMTLALIAIAVLPIKRRIYFYVPLLLFCLSLGSAFCMTYLCRDASVSFALAGDGMVCTFSERGKSVAVDCSDGKSKALATLVGDVKLARCTEVSDLILTRYVNGYSAYLYRLAGKIRIGTLHLPPPLTEKEAGIARRLHADAEKLGMKVVYDCDEVGIPSMEVVRYAHAPTEETSVAGVLFFARLRGVGVTCMNMSCLMTPLASEAQNVASSSRYLMVAGAGMVKANTEMIPTSRSGCQEVILEEARMRERVFPVRSDVRVHVCLGRIRFFVKEAPKSQ